MKYTNIVIVILFAVFLSLDATAQSPEEKGLDIAKAIKAQDVDWKDSTVNIKMILRTKNGKELEREMRSKNLEVVGDGDKSLTIFDTPLDVKGTTFLSFSHPLESDDQWLYLPSLKRVKRIASKKKTGPFLGSEFSFEDLSSFQIEKFSYTLLGEETVADVDMHLLEMRPADEYSAYTRIVAWVDKEHHRFFRKDFYNERDVLMKTLKAEGYKLYKEKFWRPTSQFMVNHQSGKSTDIKFSNLEFGVGLTDKDFNEKRLNRRQ
jgi:outer membrane lipoprotein-sorting protein